MREVFALLEKLRFRPTQSETMTEKKQATHGYFETFLWPPTIFKAQVKEPNLAPDDSQGPKDDESLLNDVGAGDRRYRLSFTVEPHERKDGRYAGFQARVRDRRELEGQ